MEDDSKFGGMVKWGLGAVGLGAFVAVVSFDNKKHGIYVALAILVLFLLIFGGYYLWRRMRARRQSKMFSSAIEAQTAAAPRAISDPNRRAALDKLRQKFQTGMQEFKSRGKDIYKLPWYVIIGESGSGKTEAIRHSGIEFPPGLQDELQGSGGTVNMDWWFTNRAIILDTAGSMIFRETQAGDAPEWREFLRLLKKSRPHCPVNGLFLVLSIESLIKDSAEKIAEKATKLAQQLDLIQRTLDVRFPVYLLVTKADLLTGFREFFDNIEDPLLQHQIFGWSNPDPLDSHFRPELVEQHLKSVADRLRRRRLALLLRETSSAGRPGGDTTSFSASQPLGGGRGGHRKLDEVDALFALPESVMRLAPRLRRYLERVFVAGEWSAKPVFLRGIYFTSSMREGKALDEAIALATGLTVDQLPEDRTWEKNRAFFLRDLFVEKVFCESGLVTRATNTIQLLRKRKLAIFGTAAVALLLLIVVAGFGYRNLQRSVLEEAAEWEAGNKGWNQNAWSPSIIRAGSDEVYHFTYAGTNLDVKVGAQSLSVVGYHQRLAKVAAKELPVPLIFRPLKWFGFGEVKERKNAQRILFEHGVLKPLVEETRKKIQGKELAAGDAKAVARYREALLSLIQLEMDRFATNKGYLGGSNAAANYLNSFLSYLTDSETSPVDTSLVASFAWTYSKGGSGDGKWPPEHLLGGNHLSNNPAIATGLVRLRAVNRISESQIENQELPKLNEWTDNLAAYRLLEIQWFTNPNATEACRALTDELSRAMENVQNSRSELLNVATDLGRPLTNIASCYEQLATASTRVSALSFSNITFGLPDAIKTEPGGLLDEIRRQLAEFNKEAARAVFTNYFARTNGNLIAQLDSSYLSATASNSRTPVFELRSSLYSMACKLASESAAADDNSIGDEWMKFERLTTLATNINKELAGYRGPYADQVQSACERIAGHAERQLKERYVENYVSYVTQKLGALASNVFDFQDVTNARPWLEKVSNDLKKSERLGRENADKLEPVRNALQKANRDIPQNYAKGVLEGLRSKLKFPVLLSSTETLDGRGLKVLKGALGRLTGELADSVWLAFPGSGAILEALRTDSYASVVDSLVNPDDTVADVKVLFTPPIKQSSEEALFKFGALRYAKVLVDGVGKLNQDLSRYLESTDVVAILTNTPINSGLKIEFFSDVERKIQTTNYGEDNWTLLRLIQSGQAEQINNKGTDWKLKLRVTVDGTARTMEAFQIRLNKPLPRKEDWPK